jgi:DNA repair exonuclease SbcCD ATPase subunit
VTNDLDQSALQKLHELLAVQTELATQQAEANRLTAEELRVRGEEAENERRKIELQSQGLAIEKERLNRAEARLQEFVIRYSQAENKLITTDDAFGETVQRVIERLRQIEDSQRDIEKGRSTMTTSAAWRSGPPGGAMMCLYR